MHRVSQFSRNETVCVLDLRIPKAYDADNSLFLIMKLHLPKVLLSAVLTACCAFSAQAVDIPGTYEQIDIWDSGYLSDYTSNTATDFYAFLLGLDTVISSDIKLDGGNLLFSSYDGLPPVSLEFSGGDAPALSNQESLVFDTLSHLSVADYSAGAISIAGNLSIQNVDDGVEDAETPDVFFTGNSTIDASDSTYGGAIYALGNATLSGNGDVTFAGNFSTSTSGTTYGGAIYAYGDVNICKNGDVKFSENFSTSTSGSSYGGAIYAHGNVTISGNGNVNFTGNLSSSCYRMETHSDGSAICADGDVNIIGNGDVSFIGNTSNNAEYIFGSTISAGGDVNIIGNGHVSFIGNTSNNCYHSSVLFSFGDVNLSGNEDVSFIGNTASNLFYFDGGLTISGNKDVFFSENTVSGLISAAQMETVTISGNENVTFTKNASSGAIHVAYADMLISRNKDVTFSENGQAIWAYLAAVTISGNRNVTFTGNGSSDSYLSGAIDSGVDVNIIGNDTVCFEKNYQKVNSTYRLYSICADGNLNLSAKTGGHITSYDSVYGGTTSLNADYTDGDGNTQQAKGDIIFSGQYTKAHLDAILEKNNEGRVATDAEILNSRTSTLGDTTLYRGSLQVVEGAVLDTTSLTVAAGSSASVLLRDAGLNGAISFGAGTSLELQGMNTTTGSLILGDAVSLTVTLDSAHLATAALTLTGSVSTGTLGLNLNVAEERASGMYRILSAGSLASAGAWTAENVSVQGSGAAAGAAFVDLVWQSGTLYYVAAPVWSNYSGSGIWSSTDTNWNNGSAFRAGQDVIFMDRGAGEVQLVGELSPASIHVQNTAGNDYAFTGSGKLGGNTTLTKTGAGELTLATANDYTGATELQEGTLNVHHSTALGATATGEATLTAAAGTILKVDNNSHLVLAGSGNSLAGAVEVAAGSTLEMKGSGYAATSSTVNGTLALSGSTVSTGTTTVNGTLSLTDTTAFMGTTTVNGTLSLTDTTASTEELSGSGTVQATDSQVTVGKISGFTGNIKVEGKGAGLSIESGSYTGAGTLSVAGGTLTFGAKANITLNAGGQLVLQSWDDAVAGVTVNNITVRAGATLAAKAGVAALGDMPETSSQELLVDLNCSRLTLNSGATLEADGACFDLNNGVLTLAVTAASTEKIELVLAENAVYTGSEQIGLFVNVGQGIFAYNGINSSTGSESLYTLNAADYFTGTGINETTQLVYDCSSGTVYLQGVVTIPEPATATLSLLALAGLCARRRRK